jgi:hypothetical protein
VSCLLLLLLLLLLQLEEWEADPSPSQLSLLEAVREVLAALLKDLGRWGNSYVWLKSVWCCPAVLRLCGCCLRQ